MAKTLFLVVIIILIISPFIVFTIFKKREWKLINVGDDIFYQRLTG